jgi:hypothetical protein
MEYLVCAIAEKVSGKEAAGLERAAPILQKIWAKSNCILDLWRFSRRG